MEKKLGVVESLSDQVAAKEDELGAIVENMARIEEDSAQLGESFETLGNDLKRLEEVGDRLLNLEVTAEELDSKMKDVLSQKESITSIRSQADNLAGLFEGISLKQEMLSSDIERMDAALKEMEKYVEGNRPSSRKPPRFERSGPSN